METTPVSNIIEMPSEYQKDLLWSLRPTIYSMQMMGIVNNSKQFKLLKDVKLLEKLKLEP